MSAVAPIPATPAHTSGGLTDDGLYQLISAGVIIGTPLLFVVAVAIAYISGVGVGNALAIAIIPALFGGVTFGGFGVLMRHLKAEDRAQDAARAARAARSALTVAPAAAAAAA